MRQQLADQPYLLGGQALQDVLQVRVRIKPVETGSSSSPQPHVGPLEAIQRTASSNAPAQSGGSGSPPSCCRSVTLRRRCSASVRPIASGCSPVLGSMQCHQWLAVGARPSRHAAHQRQAAPSASESQAAVARPDRVPRARSRRALRRTAAPVRPPRSCCWRAARRTCAVHGPRSRPR